MDVAGNFHYRSRAGLSGPHDPFFPSPPDQHLRRSKRLGPVRARKMGFIQRSICVLILTATLQHASSFLLPRLIARKASPPPAPLQYSVTDVAPSPTADLFTLPRGERTLRILESVENSDEAGGAGSGLSVATFQRLEKAWEGVKSMPKSKKEAGKAPVFVTESATPLQEGEPEFDAVVCGGTLGIFMAGALQNKGFRVCVVERDALKGRVQEWNLSR